MKGVVFSLNKNDGGKKRVKRRVTFADIRYFFRRYGLIFLSVLLLFCGLALGAVYAQSAGQSMLDSLDFLFSTNLDARLSQGLVGTFCACFASDFIFLAAIFLLGLAPWGSVFIPAVLLFKGFGTGLTAGYLFVEHSLKGVGFYLLIVMPGTFVFCLSLVLFSASAFKFSKRMFTAAVSSNAPKSSIKPQLLIFCSRAMSALVAAFLSSMLDAALWTLLAGIFHF